MSDVTDPHRTRILNDCIPVLGVELTNASVSIDVTHADEYCRTYNLLPSGVAARRILTVQTVPTVEVETIEGVDLVAWAGDDTCTEFNIVCCEHAEAFNTVVSVDKPATYKLFGSVWKDDNEDLFFNVQQMKAVGEAVKWNYLVNTAGVVAGRAERLHRYRTGGSVEPDVLRGEHGVSDVKVDVVERVDDVYNIPCEEFIQTATTIVDNVSDETKNRCVTRE